MTEVEEYLNRRKEKHAQRKAEHKPKILIVDDSATIREGRVIACDSVEALSRTTARRVSVRGEVSLEGLGGIRDREDSPGGVNFLYSGDMNLLLQRLAAGRVSDLSVSEPDLEEMFLHYYES